MDPLRRMQITNQIQIQLAWSKDASNRMCEEQNDFYWLGEKQGEVAGIVVRRRLYTTTLRLALL